MDFNSILLVFTSLFCGAVAGMMILSLVQINKGEDDGDDE